MRFAILGTRGIPARYGGFETFAEELSTRLAQRGHEVTVYCRQKHDSTEYLGVKLIYLPTISHKYLDTIAHTFISTLHLITHRVDAALYCNAANALFCWMPRAAGVPVALNVDGLERNRKKWNRVARAWYVMSEKLATFCPNEVVSDADVIQQYYRDRYSKATHAIPYGAETGKLTTTAALDQLNLEPGCYFLYVSRMEPENNALLVRQAFEQVTTEYKLALIGDAPYAHEYIRQVRDTRDTRVVMPGSVYGTGYKELGSHCFAYIQATEVGGTHPALIEAMGRGALVLYLNTPENAEVAGGVAIPFEKHNLAAKLREVLTMPQAELEDYRSRARRRVEERYSWDAVTTQYELLLTAIAGNR